MAPEISQLNSSSLTSLEGIMLQLAQACLWPVTVLILIAFAFSLVSIGGFLQELFIRWRTPHRLLHFTANEGESIERMELRILNELEGLRLCSRIAPMLGLVATMIPLGPALVMVASGQPGQSQAVLSELAASFAAVIVSLVAASITFAIHTIRRRWLLREMTEVLERRAS